MGTADDGFQAHDDEKMTQGSPKKPAFDHNTSVGDINDLDQLNRYYQALKEMHLNRLAANTWAGPAYLRLQRALGGGVGAKPGAGAWALTFLTCSSNE